jgi:hypothetical protein
MKRLMATCALLAVTVGLAALPAVASAKSCSASYVKGKIGGATKCLRRGEYCARSYANQYHRYGFNCVALSGAYHLEPRRSA